MNPVIVLVRPQLGENIGKAARAMLNFGLTELRIVAPRDGWPNPTAGPAAAGADSVIADAQIYDTVAEAVADCRHVYATTVRKRGITKPVELEVEFSGVVVDPFGATRAGNCPIQPVGAASSTPGQGDCLRDDPPRRGVQR